MSSRSSSSHQKNKWSQNESEKEKKEKIKETDSTFGSRSSRQPSFGKPRFHLKRHEISKKKLVNFDLKVFHFYWKGLISLTFGWARNLNFCKQPRWNWISISMLFCTRPDPVLSQNKEILATNFSKPSGWSNFGIIEKWQNLKPARSLGLD